MASASTGTSPEGVAIFVPEAKQGLGMDSAPKLLRFSDVVPAKVTVEPSASVIVVSSPDTVALARALLTSLPP
jgi:hypothetical protein